MLLTDCKVKLACMECVYSRMVVRTGGAVHDKLKNWVT